MQSKEKDMPPRHIELNPKYQERRNRALGLKLGYGSKYETSANSCNCPDAQYRAPEGWCKHRIAADMELDWETADRAYQKLQALLADPTLGGLYPA